MRKGNEIGAWMPIEIEPLLSSAAVCAMKDFQRWWYLSLLLRAWQNVTRPCHIPNDAEHLWTWAGSASRSYFERHSAIVIAQFVEIENGQWLVHPKQLEVYNQQLARMERRRKAANSRWGKMICNANALHMHCNDTQSNSRSGTATSTEDYMERLRAIQFRRSDDIAAEHAFAEVLETGADPEKVIEACCRIYLWTDRGIYARDLADVIRRWKEPQHLWQRKNGQEPTIATVHAHCCICGKDMGPLEAGETPYDKLACSDECHQKAVSQ